MDSPTKTKNAQGKRSRIPKSHTSPMLHKSKPLLAAEYGICDSSCTQDGRDYNKSPEKKKQVRQGKHNKSIFEKVKEKSIKIEGVQKNRKSEEERYMFEKDDIKRQHIFWNQKESFKKLIARMNAATGCQIAAVICPDTLNVTWLGTSGLHPREYFRAMAAQLAVAQHHKSTKVLVSLTEAFETFKTGDEHSPVFESVETCLDILKPIIDEYDPELIDRVQERFDQEAMTRATRDKGLKESVFIKGLISYFTDYADGNPTNVNRSYSRKNDKATEEAFGSRRSNSNNGDNDQSASEEDSVSGGGFEADDIDYNESAFNLSAKDDDVDEEEDKELNLRAKKALNFDLFADLSMDGGGGFIGLNNDDTVWKLNLNS